jgi:hypothetical protein
MITTETSQNHVIAAIQAGAQGDILQPFTGETFEAKGAIVWREESARYMGGKAHACWDVSHSIWTAFHGVNAAIKLHIRYRSSDFSCLFHLNPYL